MRVRFRVEWLSSFTGIRNQIPVDAYNEPHYEWVEEAIRDFSQFGGNETEAG